MGNVTKACMVKSCFIDCYRIYSLPSLFFSLMGVLDGARVKTLSTNTCNTLGVSQLVYN